MNKVKIIFDRGVYVGKNTFQAASVELVRQRRTNYARSRLQKSGGKARRDFSTNSDAFQTRLFSCEEKLRFLFSQLKKYSYDTGRNNQHGSCQYRDSKRLSENNDTNDNAGNGLQCTENGGAGTADEEDAALK